MSKHTLGPWRYNRELSSHGTQLVYGPDGCLVADAGRIQKRSTEESEANAQLIAAAPEMLEALEKAQNLIIRIVENPDDKIISGALGTSIEIVGAIAKARAEP